jgi:hypothetical protein
VAAAIKKELGIDAELVEGTRGEFTVWAGDRQVAQKRWLRFPTDKSIITAIREALD